MSGSPRRPASDVASRLQSLGVISAGRAVSANIDRLSKIVAHRLDREMPDGHHDRQMTGPHRHASEE